MKFPWFTYLTFSCDNKENLRRCKKVIEDITYNEGYSINKSKTRYLSPRSHKRVTGVTITQDNKLKAKKQTKKKVRAMIHNAIVTKNYCQTMRIKGYISYINSIEDGYRQKIIVYINRLIKRDYRCFKGIVNEYNKNKNLLIKGLDDMVYKVFTDQVQEEVAYTLEETGDYISADDILDCSYLNRYNYLIKYELKEDEQEYIELAKVIKNTNRQRENKEDDSQRVLPF
ncbi:hypothetical protein [Clostridium estertheticum]|uniref:hypothetical protein n=1 Tax=Clostridium estertheticum TaxID=238834 RepID=UPI001C0E4338|nr:hypothetical protein [Clostridium estertheticum]MBU3171489.1 hypothetical protein [Clostridium estertheticum]